MNNTRGGGLDVRTVLLLLTGGIGTYAAFPHPASGTALMAGIGVITTHHILLKRR